MALTSAVLAGPIFPKSGTCNPGCGNLCRAHCGLHRASSTLNVAVRLEERRPDLLIVPSTLVA